MCVCVRERVIETEREKETHALLTVSHGSCDMGVALEH